MKNHERARDFNNFKHQEMEATINGGTKSNGVINRVSVVPYLKASASLALAYPLHKLCSLGPSLSSSHVTSSSPLHIMSRPDPNFFYLKASVDLTQVSPLHMLS